MEIVRFDQKEEGEATCHLCRVKLKDYVLSIPDDYNEFEVQRGIVTNKFLDGLITTVLEEKHIPPLVLMADEVKENRVQSFKVLDGLQRTHRLNVIWKTINLIEDNQVSGDETSAKLARNYSKQLRKIGSNSKTFITLMDAVKAGKSLKDLFENNTIWIEVWENLNTHQQIEKMLLLNAGHKAVNIKHQVELLYLNTLKFLRDSVPEIKKIYREKDKSVIQYSKSRSMGEYHFAHLISAMLSIIAGKAVNTNTDFVSNAALTGIETYDLPNSFDDNFMVHFMRFVVQLDTLLHQNYPKFANFWIGREVVLVGFFGAIGQWIENKHLTLTDGLQEASKFLADLVLSLNPEGFEDARNDVQLAKVNIGNVNKRAVYEAMLEKLTNQSWEQINWDIYFSGGANAS